MPRSDAQKATGDALAGALASLLSLWVFYPIDVLKTRIQAGAPVDPKKSWISGLEWKTLHTGCSSFCYFYLYSWIFSSWQRYRRGAGSKQSQQQTSVAARLALASFAAMLNTWATLPLDVVSSRMQAAHLIKQQDPSTEEQNDATSPSKIELEQRHNQRLTQLSKAVRIRIGQVLSYWKGLGPSLLLCSNPAIHYTVFDSVKQYVLAIRADPSLSMAEAFLLGLFAKFIATIATYPLIRAKVMLMVTSRTCMFQCLRDEYKRDGVRGLYTGCNLQLVHTLLKSALLMMVRERITETAHNLVSVKSRA